MLLMILAGMAFANVDPSSEPADPMTLRLTLQSIYDSTKAKDCLDDLPCWKRRTDRLKDAVLMGISGLRIDETRMADKDALISSLATHSAEQTTTINDAKSELERAKPVFDVPPHREPILWISIGLVIGVGLSFASVAAWNGMAHAIH